MSDAFGFIPIMYKHRQRFVARRCPHPIQITINLNPLGHLTPLLRVEFKEPRLSPACNREHKSTLPVHDPHRTLGVLQGQCLKGSDAAVGAKLVGVLHAIDLLDDGQAISMGRDECTLMDRPQASPRCEAQVLALVDPAHESARGTVSTNQLVHPCKELATIPPEPPQAR